MDPETLYESIREILNRYYYKLEAGVLFREELSTCTELTEDEKSRLLCLVMNFDGSDIDKTIKEIASLLVKSDSFAKFIDRVLLKSVGSDAIGPSG